MFVPDPGGAVSVRVALRYPEMVDKLVLVSPGGFGRQLGLVHRLASLPLLGEILTRPSLAGVDDPPGLLSREWSLQEAGQHFAQRAAHARAGDQPIAALRNIWR